MKNNNVRLEWEVSHDQFQLSIANGSGEIVKSFGVDQPRPATTPSAGEG